MADLNDGSYGSEVAEFYRGRDVLLTGASGFLGKVVLEKLLRSCPVGNIYVAVRPKRKVDFRKRVDEMLNCALFDSLRSRPAVMSKVIPVRADLCSPGLGLSERDRRVLQDNVSVVLHCAASVRMDESLKEAVATNLHGTYELLKLSRNMGRLEAFVHVSTVYGNCEREKVEEIIYETTVDPEFMLQMVQWLKEDYLKLLTPYLVDKKPNTYTYTKALAEKLLLKYSKDIPAAIIRPSIVTASNAEPVPGWIEGLHGATGLVAGIGQGVIRSLHCDKRLNIDLVPVDFVANAIIAAGWRTAYHRNEGLMVYNCSSGHANPHTINQFVNRINEWFLKYPTCSSAWYPGNTLMIRNKYLQKALVFCNEMIPAQIADAVLHVFGNRKRFCRLFSKIQSLSSQLDYFITHGWYFDAKNMDRLRLSMNEVDRKLFNFDFREIEWSGYVRSYTQGITRYILKESPSRHPESKRYLRKLFYLDLLLKLFLVYLGYRVTNIFCYSLGFGLESIGDGVQRIIEDCLV